MNSHLTVSWGSKESHQVDLNELQPMTQDMARRWLEDQFQFFDCDPVRATGKVLTVDKVLAVAQAAGLARFAEAAHRPWAMAFGRAASAALAKPVLHIDLFASTVTY